MEGKGWSGTLGFCENRPNDVFILVFVGACDTTFTRAPTHCPYPLFVSLRSIHSSKRTNERTNERTRTRPGALHKNCFRFPSLNYLGLSLFLICMYVIGYRGHNLYLPFFPRISRLSTISFFFSFSFALLSWISHLILVLLGLDARIRLCILSYLFIMFSFLFFRVRTLEGKERENEKPKM